MAGHPLDGCWGKVCRARTHLEALNNEVDAFIATKPYRTYVEVDHKLAKKVQWIEVETPPPCIALILGDLIHNLRSALDHLAYQMAALHGEPPFHTQFPVFINEDEFDHGRVFGIKPNGDQRRGRSGRQMISGVHNEAAIELVKQVQPYHRAEAVRRMSGLWLINEISNIDKHRLSPTTLLYASALGASAHVDEISVNFGPYQGQSVLAMAPVDVPDEDMQVDIGPFATVALEPTRQIPRLSDGLVRVLDRRCFVEVEWLLRESVRRGIFPPLAR